MRNFPFEPENFSPDRLPQGFWDLLEESFPGRPTLHSWKDFRRLFSRKEGLWARPLLLFIDEVDTVPSSFLDLLIGQFREMYLQREDNWLHGLALLGIRAVFGIESDQGSPFNIQRSLQVPNLTQEEVIQLFQQYETESGQEVEHAVVQELYEATKGQPGLISWFGELLTETYNDQKKQRIHREQFRYILQVAAHALPNNNILNLISKAKKSPYREIVLELFKTSAKIPFLFDDERHSYLYMNGITGIEMTPKGLYMKFSSSFVQKRLFNHFSHEIFQHLGKILENPFDSLDNCITETGIDIRNLLRHYQSYLKNNQNWLFKDAPRRTDLRIYEAIFHFNLFLFLSNFLEDYDARIVPEFPTGNGQIDLIIQYAEQTYGLELKSYRNRKGYQDALLQATRYGKQLGLREIFVIFFVETIDETNRNLLEADFLDSATGVRACPIFIESIESP